MFPMKKKTIRTAVPIGIVAVFTGWMGMACASIPSDIGLNSGELRPCEATPNCVCSEGENASIEPLAYTGDGLAAFRSLLEFLKLQSNVEMVTVEERYAHAVYRTPLLRFRDDLELRLDEAGAVIHVRSASRVGYSDMGANRRRVEDLRASWSLRSAE
jgi:uncharacterized protein (DUF1499 family)